MSETTSPLQAVQSNAARARQIAIVDAEAAELVRRQLGDLGRASAAVWEYMPLPTINLYGGDRTDHWKVLLDEIVMSEQDDRRYHAVAIHKSGEVHDVVLNVSALPEAKTVEDIRPVSHRYRFAAAHLDPRECGTWSREAITDALIAAHEAAAVVLDRRAAEQSERQAASAARQARIAGLSGCPV
jgi:hypothetical protein